VSYHGLVSCLVVDIPCDGPVRCLVMDLEVVLSWTFKLSCHGPGSCLATDLRLFCDKPVS